jgi:hypothetical protein
VVVALAEPTVQGVRAGSSSVAEGDRLAGASSGVSSVNFSCVLAKDGDAHVIREVFRTIS